LKTEDRIKNKERWIPSCEGMTYGKAKYAKRADLVSALFA